LSGLSSNSTRVINLTNVPRLSFLSYNKWAQISLAPNIILLLFPSYDGNKEGLSFLSLGQAVAAGGLLGDVFLHTLPHASKGDEAGLWILGGFTLFLTADLFIRSLEGQREDDNAVDDKEDNLDNNEHHEHKHSHSHSNINAPASVSMIILNMTADALHNFTDGLTIGASFAAASFHSKNSSFLSLLASRGGLASLSILLHEVPHEHGDYCTLLRAGYTKRQAIRAQFVTALAAFAGTAVALFAVQATDNQFLMYVTAGGFLYLSATTIVPEVLHDRGSLWFRIAQLLAFCSGIGLLYLVARLEGHDHSHGDAFSHGHPEHQHHFHHERSYEDEVTSHHDHGEL
jgi:zinc transporter 7